MGRTSESWLEVGVAGRILVEELADYVLASESMDGEGLVVSSPGGPRILMPLAAVEASPVLRTLATDELADGGPQADAHVPMVPIPLEFGGGSGATECGLQGVAAAFQPGGFPLCLRWRQGDMVGIAAAVATLSCAQFLDMPLLTERACDEFAVALAICCADADEVSAYFDVQSEAEASVCVADGMSRSGCTSTDTTEEEHALMAKGPALGNRGRSFIYIWSCGRSPLAQLPAECLQQIVERADAMVRTDNGVCELLALAPASTLLDAVPPQEALGADAPATTLAPEDAASAADVCHALDIILARSQRYKGSTLVLAALASHAVSERNAPHLRVRAVRALAHVANVGDAPTSVALRDIISASHDSGGALFEEAECSSPTNARASGESPVQAAARRMRLDGAWQVRAVACEALVDIATTGDRDAVDVLSRATEHGFFEVRLAAVTALGRIASTGDLEAAMTLVRAVCDDDWRVREAAVEALAKLHVREASCTAEEGQSLGLAIQLVPAICDHLGNRSADVAQSARAALRCLAEKGNRQVTARAIVRGVSQAVPGRRVPLLRRPIPEVRRAAVDVLGDALQTLSFASAGMQVGASDCVSVQESLEVGLREATRVLSDRSSFVRHAAASALGGFARNVPFPPDTRKQIVRMALDVLQAPKTPCSSWPEEAFEVLRSNATPGDQSVIEVAEFALRQLEAPCRVRRLAARTIGSLATPGDVEASKCLLAVIYDADADVREEVFRALESVCLGSAAEVEAIAEAAADTAASVQVRCRALQCLSRMAPSGSSVAMKCAIDTLSSNIALLRAEALGVVVRIAEPGDTAAKALVAARLGDNDQEVCRRAMDACETIAEHGDLDVVDALVEHIVGESCLRQVAVRTLQRVCRRGDPAVLSRLLPWLEQGHWPQRQAALEAFAELSAPGDKLAIEAVMQRLSDGDETCRQTACEVLGKVAQPGDESVVSMLILKLHDSSWLVRDAAGHALAKLATLDQLAKFEQEVESIADDIRGMVLETLAAARGVLIDISRVESAAAVACLGACQ
mmetsp:Transcript_5350/g.20165  ORF Transcript_5350/g.20165 Transcript_5350/m.20165 type:complete len:1036 (+) Transcript_5350:158-3265(+)|eukprot:CAMPEP_0203899506 /NCGR_PEP_ID=MMETSP0359-20131031/41908_1 /ASSEMBLY_ACC=CAM_ASM_000338 /TAXON_ID=268821 /ORGANISM="Scrippsiella Hangoei, Strain SHTV-5" /LENGTH=1035 /DNA_ID=CAMNT_0050822773 /DNA_START=112 /DNA_END=3219 /DNA_ORIENTATION=+